MIYVLVTNDGSMVKFGHTTADELSRATSQTKAFPCKFYCALDGSSTHEQRTHRHLRKLGLEVEEMTEWFWLRDEAKDYVEWLGQQYFVTTDPEEAAFVSPHPGRFIWENWRASMVPDQRDDQMHFPIAVVDYFVPGLRRPMHAPDRKQGFFSSVSDEWYTPVEFVEAVHEVMGGIDLDPASCPPANKVVRADAIYTRDVNGLNFEWHGRVYLNPPYGTEGPLFVAHLMDEVAAGRTTEAIVCLNANSQESRWFQPLWDHTLCFVRGRVHFYNSFTDEKPPAPNKGTVFVYLGPNDDRFVEVFSSFGNVVRRVQPSSPLAVSA